MSGLLFISWAEDCSRSDNIARQLGGTSHMIYSPRWGSRYGTILFKYLSQTLKTLKLLWRERPNTVFVMTPPPFACLPVWLYCLVTPASFVIDAHSASFLHTRWKKLPFIHRFFSKRARATLVTNTELEALVHAWGATAMIVPDVPIRFKDPQEFPTVPGKKLTLVSTFAHDEPVELLVEAARLLPDVHFYITGNTADAPPGLIASIPANVTATGFIPRAKYIGLLMASDAVMTMTTRDNTMQRGAYEAIYLGRPVITSDHPFLRQEFRTGAVHAALSVDGLREAVEAFYRDPDHYADGAAQLKKYKLERWNLVSRQLRKVAQISEPTDNA
ncbi:MAG: glycosyltransferase [Gammaproteobacteria bacterium]